MREQHSEHGFGMIEVVVSIFMLGLLAIAFIPVLIQGVRTTSANSTLATATQLVNQSIEQLRSTPPSQCSDLSQSTTAMDAQGNALTVTRMAIDCDPADGLPELVSVSVVSSADPTQVLASATTHVRLAP